MDWNPASLPEKPGTDLIPGLVFPRSLKGGRLSTDTSLKCLIVLFPVNSIVGKNSGIDWLFFYFHDQAFIRVFVINPTKPQNYSYITSKILYNDDDVLQAAPVIWKGKQFRSPGGRYKMIPAHSGVSW